MSGNSRQRPTNINRSSALKLNLFRAVRRKTMICCRRTRFSASSDALDRNSPISSDQINLQPSNIGRGHHPIRPSSPTDDIYGRDSHKTLLRPRSIAMRSIASLPRFTILWSRMARATSPLCSNWWRMAGPIKSTSNQIGNCQVVHGISIQQTI